MRLPRHIRSCIAGRILVGGGDVSMGLVDSLRRSCSVRPNEAILDNAMTNWSRGEEYMEYPAPEGELDHGDPRADETSGRIGSGTFRRENPFRVE